MNTHYAVIVFSGDPASEHPDERMCGQPPSLALIACGPEEFCWDALKRWTKDRPLRLWEDAEVLSRDLAVVVAGSSAALGGQTDG